MVRSSSTTTASMIMPVPLVAPTTNKVFKLNFGWDYDTNDLALVDTFTLYMGYDSNTMAFVQDTGTNLFFTFLRTNWDDRLTRHYFVVTAKGQGTESDPSNVVHYPPFPADHIRLIWQTNWPTVVIYTTTNIFLDRNQWDVLDSVGFTNQYETLIVNDGQPHYFIIDQSDVLQIVAFNPFP